MHELTINDHRYNSIVGRCTCGWNYRINVFTDAKRPALTDKVRHLHAVHVAEVDAGAPDEPPPWHDTRAEQRGER